VNIGLCVPTCEAEKDLPRLLEVVEDASALFHRVLFIDSSSSDRTQQLVKRSGFELLVVEKADFDHGGTRQKGVEQLKDCQIVMFLTHDAVPVGPDDLRVLVDVFSDPRVGCAFGRQLPRPGARPMEAHARLFNYPEHSVVKEWPQARSLGIMAGAVSNSFAAYRREALEQIGGFPSGMVCSEDVYVGFKALLSGWKVVYCAESRVYHSHDLSPWQELRRYFDIGAFYGSFETWIVHSVGSAESKGIAFVLSQIRYLAAKAPWLIPLVPVSAMAKYVGYRLGARHQKLPSWLIHRLGLNRPFWDRNLSGRT